MKIYLIRHAESFREELSENGKTQAKIAGLNLAVRGVTRENSRLFTSPEVRVRLTAEVIAREAGLHAPEAVLWIGEKAELWDFVITGLLATANREDYRRHIVVVSHAPVLEMFLNGFIKGVMMQHGDVYEVDVDTQKAEKLG